VGYFRVTPSSWAGFDFFGEWDFCVASEERPHLLIAVETYKAQSVSDSYNGGNQKKIKFDEKL
jgi:hypothetical protein